MVFLKAAKLRSAEDVVDVIECSFDLQEMTQSTFLHFGHLGGEQVIAVLALAFRHDFALPRLVDDVHIDPIEVRLEPNFLVVFAIRRGVGHCQTFARTFLVARECYTAPISPPNTDRVLLRLCLKLD